MRKRAVMRVGRLNFLAWLLLIPAIALSAFLCVAQSGAVYGWIQDRHVDERSTGVSDADRYRLNDALAAYIRGEQAELDDTASVYGAEQTAFNERERAHMVDVLKLFALARTCRWALLICGVAALIMPLRRRVRLLPGYLAALGAWLTVLGTGAAWAAKDFTAVFIWFHRMLFSNELWLLDPKTDLMIRVLPEAFFAEIAGWAVAAVLVALAAVGIALGLLQRNRARNTDL